VWINGHILALGSEAHHGGYPVCDRPFCLLAQRPGDTKFQYVPARGFRLEAVMPALPYAQSPNQAIVNLVAFQDGLLDP
jgi:hypothetical protein